MTRCFARARRSLTGALVAVRRALLTAAVVSASAAAAAASAQRDWQLGLTPFVPASWPPDGTIVAYAFGRRIGGVSDGEHVSRPFAQVRCPASGPPTIAPLTPRLETLGIQGMKPVMRETAERQAALGERVQRSLRGTRRADAIDRAAAHEYYARYRDWNGLLARELARAHPAFFAWADAMPIEARPPAYGTARPNGRAPVERDTLPVEIATWIGPHTIYATTGKAWRVVTQLDTGVLRVDDGERSFTVTLDEPARAELQRLAAAALLARATGDTDETLVLGSPAGAYFLRGAMPAPAAALIKRLRALGR